MCAAVVWLAVERRTMRRRTCVRACATRVRAPWCPRRHVPTALRARLQSVLELSRI